MTKKEFLLQNKEAVKIMFIDENRTVVEVAEKFNCSTAVLQRFLREQGISVEIRRFGCRGRKSTDDKGTRSERVD